MKVHFLLFLCVIVAICSYSRAHMLPHNRQGPQYVPVPYNHALYSKGPENAQEEPVSISEYPNPKTRMVNPYSPYNPTDGQHPHHASGTIGRQLDALRQRAQADRQVQLAYLDQIDREALSKVSEADRQLLLSKLTQADREALLTQFENGQLDDVIPRDENRFGFGQSGGLAGAAAQIGAGAGGYIGGKLAGALGAKLGAAAGAYLGAAAASRFDFSGGNKNNNADSNGGGPSVQYDGGYGGGFGAVLVKNK